jgi:hypothetical protein
MSEVTVSSIEDAVIRVCTVKEPLSRVVVDTFDSTFLAYNTVNGYSAVDFRRPDNKKLRELSAILEAHCDFGRTDRLYTGLYLDMITLVAPETEIVFSRDGASSASYWCGEAEASAMHNANRRGALAGRLGGAHAGHARPEGALSRVLGAGRRMRAGAKAAGAATEDWNRGAEVSRSEPATTTLVTFGCSCTYGTEIDTSELGHEDDTYRSERAYPYLLARELGVEYGANLAESGRGNNKILRRVCDFVAEHRRDLSRYFIVVGLTHVGRKGFVLRNGWEYLFVNTLHGMEPWVIKTLCAELFCPFVTDPTMNQEVEHKYWVLHSFLKKLGCRFAIFPIADFADSDKYFRSKDLGRHGLFCFGSKFGFRGLVNHLPLGKEYHPLSEGHALFARELALAIRERGLL